MIGHMGLNLSDLGEATAYYDELMPLLGYEPFFPSEGPSAYMPAAGGRGAYLFLYQALQPGAYSRDAAGLQHLAFVVPTRSAVRAVHTHVISRGDEVLYP